MAKQTGAQVEARLEQGIKDRPPGRHGFGDGLWLEVGGRRSWTLRYMIAGRARSMGLGPWPEVSLTAAREKVTKARALIQAAKDPIDEKRHEKAAAAAERARQVTFADAAEKYISKNEDGWRNPKHRQQWRSTVDAYAVPILGKLPLSEITTRHVLKVLEPIWTTKPETASRVRGRIETVLAYGIVQGWCQEPNVARWHNHIQMTLPPRSKMRAVKPHAALAWADIPNFMEILRCQDGVGAMALEFTILTAARSGEARGALWSEIDLTRATWTIPEGRMKAKRQHIVPLSTPAVAVLRKAEAVRGGSEHIFPGMRPNTPLSDMSLSAVLRRMGRGVITVHGFRATFKTWASDETEFPREVIEASLAHAVGDKSEQTYQRGSWLERRRTLMNQWAEYCEPAEPREEAAEARVIDRAMP